MDQRRSAKCIQASLPQACHDIRNINLDKNPENMKTERFNSLLYGYVLIGLLLLLLLLFVVVVIIIIVVVVVELASYNYSSDSKQRYVTLDAGSAKSTPYFEVS